MDGFKTFYNEKKGKYILFFGFYLIFFIFFGFYMRNLRANRLQETKEEIKEEVKISSYDISNLINNDYSYIIDIIDDEEIINFTGTKNNIDYANYANKYFLDVFNINQLLKKSKFVDSENNVLTYELENKDINDILLTEKEDGVNKIMVYVNDKGEVKKFDIDLTNYFGKDKYQITISYTVGENNENSPS